MHSLPIAAIMVRESTRRHLTEPKAAAKARPRSAAAVVLARAAHRLDPHVAAAPRVNLGRR